MVQFSHPYMTIGKTIALTIWNFVGKVISLLFNMLSRFVMEKGMAQPTPVFLPGESHGWRSLVGHSPWGRKELDTTEQLHFTSLQGFLFIGLSSHMHFPRRYSRKKLPYPKFSNCICRKRKNKR